MLSAFRIAVIRKTKPPAICILHPMTVTVIGRAVSCAGYDATITADPSLDLIFSDCGRGCITVRGRISVSCVMVPVIWCWNRCCKFYNSDHWTDLIILSCPFIGCKYHFIAACSCFRQQRWIFPGKASILRASSGQNSCA